MGESPRTITEKPYEAENAGRNAWRGGDSRSRADRSRACRAEAQPGSRESSSPATGLRGRPRPPCATFTGLDRDLGSHGGHGIRYEEDSVSEEKKQPEKRHEEEFVPRGALAFMVAMILAYGAIWFFFYFLMAGRP